MFKQVLRVAIASTLTFVTACGAGADETGDDDVIATYTVNGTVRDFETGEPVSGAATVSTDGLSPSPNVSVQGASFTIQEVPPFSVFHILAGSPPNYRSTYNVATEVTDGHVMDADIFVASETYLTSLATAFGVPGGGSSVIIARVVDAGGAPAAGIPGTAFDLDDTIVGPYFLDAERLPAPGLSETSSSGYVVLFNAPAGVVNVRALADSGYSMVMPDAPVANTAATLTRITVTDADQVVLPVNVSFANDIVPIFSRRGCQVCHDGGGIGKDLGNLHLNGAREKMFRELAEEVSPTHGILRVDRPNPDLSLMLTMPSREEPADAHPNVTFASADDPDYILIKVWIAEGALNN